MFAVAVLTLRCSCSDLHVLRPAKIDMPRIVVQYWTGVAPPPKNWEMLWLAWDIVSKSMVPREALMSRPIELRNPLIFYLGHIPTFCGEQNWLPSAAAR